MVVFSFPLFSHQTISSEVVYHLQDFWNNTSLNSPQVYWTASVRDWDLSIFAFLKSFVGDAYTHSWLRTIALGKNSDSAVCVIYGMLS